MEGFETWSNGENGGGRTQQNKGKGRSRVLMKRVSFF